MSSTGPAVEKAGAGRCRTAPAMGARSSVALVAALLAIALPLAATARAGSAPDQGTAFEPRPLSEPLFGTRPPSESPERQRAIVEAHDGVDLFVETWLPAGKDGHEPPQRVPTILIMTPYVSQGVEAYPPLSTAPGIVEYFTSRGYAVAQHHVRGTGESGGCLEQTGAAQIDDGARVVEYLGRDAPWADGNVGMFGISYDAETQLSVAGLGDPGKTQYLKAIVPAASVGGQYEYSFFDGVPYAGQALQSNAFYLALVSLSPGDTSSPGQYVQKLTCQPEVMTTSADQSGDMTAFWKQREYRRGAPNIRAATLFVHGLADRNVQPITIAGFFDRLPDSTPHKGLFGVWDHAFPSRHSRVEPDWARADWLEMVTAWYDRYLKGLDTGVETWPEVQVQGTDGQWRAEEDFPPKPGRSGRLALGPGGTLGAREPTGFTSYVEGVDDAGTIPGSQAVFETPKLVEPLHLTGQPVLELTLKTSMPDGHITARLQAIGPDGAVLRHAGSSAAELATYGFRSLRHLDPMPDNYFQQESGTAAPTGVPIRVPVRFHPADLRVPVGGSLRLTIAGSLSYSRHSLPSGAASTIELLHSCTHPSVLRFAMPDPDAALLNVREWDEPLDEPLASAPATIGDASGGGLASRPSCGVQDEHAG